MMKKRVLSAVALALTFVMLLSGMALGASTAYNVSPNVKLTYDRLLSNDAVKKGLEFIKADDAKALAEQKQICEILVSSL
jgi:hypothetical protein